MTLPALLRKVFARLPVSMRLPCLLGGLLLCAGPARAGYVACPITQAVDEFNAFAGDFPRWNAVNDNMPLFALELTPMPQQGNMLLLLWWMWMLHPDLPSSSFSPTGGYSPSPPIAPIVGPIGFPPPPLPLGGNGLGNSSGNGGNGGNSSGIGGNGSPSPGPGKGDGGGSSPGESPTPFLSAPAPSALILAGWGALALLTAQGFRHGRVRPGRR